MKTLPYALALAATVSGCGHEEKDPGDLNDADLPRLHIDDVDGAHVHIYATEDVADAGTAIHLENMTQGPETDAVADDAGEIDVSMGGAIDHVYALQSRGARVLPVVRRADGAVVRGYGVGFASATGCELQGWS